MCVCVQTFENPSQAFKANKSCYKVGAYVCAHLDLCLHASVIVQTLSASCTYRRTEIKVTYYHIKLKHSRVESAVFNLAGSALQGVARCLLWVVRIFKDMSRHSLLSFTLILCFFLMLLLPLSPLFSRVMINKRYLWCLKQFCLDQLFNSLIRHFNTCQIDNYSLTLLSSLVCLFGNPYTSIRDTWQQSSRDCCYLCYWPNLCAFVSFQLSVRVLAVFCCHLWSCFSPQVFMVR